MDTFFSQTNCSRCSNPLTVRTMSWFTEETICIDCSKKEQIIKDAIRAKGEDTRAYEGCGYIPKI